MSRYRCSRHDVEMVLRVWIVKYRDGCKPVEYYGCPVPDCDMVRPCKWQKKPVKRRASINARGTAKTAANTQARDHNEERQGSLF